MARLDDPEVEITRKLDKVVGTSYHEDGADPKRRRRNAIVKAIVAAVCAVGAAGLVVYGIESHRLPSAVQMQQMPAAKPKPVTVQILPAKPPP
jgi:hypothetical protein